jgi:hypothetical protein
MDPLMRTSCRLRRVSRLGGEICMSDMCQDSEAVLASRAKDVAAAWSSS